MLYIVLIENGELGSFERKYFDTWKKANDFYRNYKLQENESIELLELRCSRSK